MKRGATMKKNMKTYKPPLSIHTSYWMLMMLMTSQGIIELDICNKETAGSATQFFN